MPHSEAIDSGALMAKHPLHCTVAGLANGGVAAAAAAAAAAKVVVGYQSGRRLVASSTACSAMEDGYAAHCCCYRRRAVSYAPDFLFSIADDCDLQRCYLSSPCDDEAQLVPSVVG